MNRMIESYLKIPSDSWWYKTRGELIYLLIKRYSSTQQPEVCDIGCGCGVTIEYLRSKGIGKVDGIDFQETFVSYASKKGGNVRLCDIEKGISMAKRYDVVILSDVLEHLNDDKKVLRDVFSLLKDEGICIVFVPAFEILWSWHDVVNGHKRRYLLKTLKGLLEEAGFKVFLSSYWNFFLFIPTLLLRITKRIFKIRRDDFYKLPDFVNRLIVFLLGIENTLIVRSFTFPFGVSALCVAKKLGKVYPISSSNMKPSFSFE